MVRDTTLRRARLAQGLTVDEVARRTRLSPRLVTLIDEGRFQELPSGLYARSFVRAFATAIGAGADAVARVEPLLPAAPDPVAALRESFGEALDAPSMAADLRRLWRTTRARAVASLTAPGRRDPARAVAARSGAAVVDTLLLAALNALLLGIVAAFCRTTLPRLLDAAGGASLLFSAIVSMLYYVILAGIGGRTPGARSCQNLPAAPEGPLRPAAILKRAGRAWLNGASIGVDVLFHSDHAAIRSLVARLDEVRHRPRAA